MIELRESKNTGRFSTCNSLHLVDVPACVHALSEKPDQSYIKMLEYYLKFKFDKHL